MIFVTAINNTANSVNYNLNSENITVPANGTTPITSNLLMAFANDPSVQSDIFSGRLTLTDSFSIYSKQDALQFLKLIIHDLTFFDKSSSGTITGVSGTIGILTNGASNITITASGTWTGNIQIYATNDGVTYFAWGGLTPTGQIISTFTANGSIQIPCGSFTQIQFFALSFSSGTLNLSWNAGAGNSVVQVYNQTAASLQAITWTYDGFGNAITSSPVLGAASNKRPIDVCQITPVTGYYSAPVRIRQSAATANGSAVWTMRNPAASTRTVIIQRIFLMIGFDAGTPLTRSFQSYNLLRFNTATPTGGTSISPAKMDFSQASTVVTDVRFLDTGLTITGVVGDNVFATIGCGASDGATNFYQRSDIGFRLAAGEGFAITLNTAAVVGQNLAGEIVWSES